MATIVLKSEPGIKRDGTKFDGGNYVDGRWVRFQRGLPRKIGGYRAVSPTLTEGSRGVTQFATGQQVICHSGSATKVERFTLDSNYNSSVLSDRTPTTLAEDSDNVWMFDYMYDSSTTDNSVIAHVSPNGSCSCNDTGGQIFIGDAIATTALTEITLPAGANATGGVVVLHPYLFYYGSDGVVGWSVAGDPTDFTTASGAGIARVWGRKVMKALPLRAGAGQAPAGLFIAEDAVIRASFTGGATVFQFDIIAANTSIMSPNAVVDYDGIIMWAGVDRFLMFNGVVKEIPNQMNLNWFFDNIRPENRAKVFTFQVPKFGEIWWCYPRGSATECDHAVIFNARENAWYDTELPASLRTSAVYSNNYAKPLMIGSGGKLWVHEIGTDEIEGTRVSPIKSYFETGDISTILQGQNQALRIERIEPDFVQSGTMSIQIAGRANARAPEVVSEAVMFPDTATEPYEELVVVKEQRRELRVRFQSDTLGGDYQMGQIIAHIEPADRRTL